jgi:hypothetical protein
MRESSAPAFPADQLPAAPDVIAAWRSLAPRLAREGRLEGRDADLASTVAFSYALHRRGLAWPARTGRRLPRAATHALEEIRMMGRAAAAELGLIAHDRIEAQPFNADGLDVELSELFEHFEAYLPTVADAR